MKLSEIKNLNQRIYTLDTQINRNSKVIFIASLIFCLTQNKDFRNVSKLTTLVNFADEETKPIDQIINIAKLGIEGLGLLPSTKKAIFDSLRTISGVNTNLDSNRKAFREFLEHFISNDYVSIKPDDLFLETLYMEIDKKAGTGDDGVVLTPFFAAQLMVDLAEIDYKKDVVADLCSGTGLFSLLSYSKMLSDMTKDYTEHKISDEEYKQYQTKLYNSIIANDNDSKMVTLCLANFLLKSLNHELLLSEDVLTLQKSSFKIKKRDQEERVQPTKAVLNPPYEDKYKPLEIVEKNISLINGCGVKNSRVVVIIPPQKFGQKKDVFSKILNISTLESVIKMQDDLFTDSGKSQPASIFVFNVDKPHKKEDKIKYYNFTDTGYVYLKDSGLVDKNHTYEQKKKDLFERMKASSSKETTSPFKRKWTNFYEVNKELEITATIDPSRIKTSKEEADITLENIIIKKMISEKEELVKEANNNFKDEDGSFERYIVDILSEE